MTSSYKAEPSFEECFDRFRFEADSTEKFPRGFRRMLENWKVGGAFEVGVFEFTESIGYC